MTCQICGASPAMPSKKDVNGLPKSVVACDGCRHCVSERKLGVSIGKGQLVIYGTDGRGRSHGGDAGASSALKASA